MTEFYWASGKVKKKLQCQDRSLNTGLWKCSCTTSEANSGSHPSCQRDSLHKTLSVHPGSEVETCRVNWSEVPMANPKSLTCECFDWDVQIYVRVANNDFLIWKFLHVIKLSSGLFSPCQYIYYKKVPWFAVLLLLIEYIVVNADVSGFQILKDSLRWWPTFVLWSHVLPSSQPVVINAVGTICHASDFRHLDISKWGN